MTGDGSIVEPAGPSSGPSNALVLARSTGPHTTNPQGSIDGRARVSAAPAAGSAGQTHRSQQPRQGPAPPNAMDALPSMTSIKVSAFRRVDPEGSGFFYTDLQGRMIACSDVYYNKFWRGESTNDTKEDKEAKERKVQMKLLRVAINGYGSWDDAGHLSAFRRQGFENGQYFFHLIRTGTKAIKGKPRPPWLQCTDHSKCT